MEARAYTKFPLFISSHFARLRTSTHGLLVEVGRYRKIERRLRLCTFGCLSVASKVHVFVECIEHKARRRRFVGELLALGVPWNNLTVVEQEAVLLDPKKKLVLVVGSFLRDLMKIYLKLNKGGATDSEGSGSDENEA